MSVNLSVRPLSERERCKPAHAKHRRQLQRQREQLKGKNLTRATLHQVTRERLYREALNDARLAWLPADEIRDYLDARIEVFLNRLPWWFGHFDKPTTQHREKQEQPEALKRYREEQRREHAEREDRLSERLQQQQQATTA